MTQAEFETLSLLCAESEVLTNVDAGDEESSLEEFTDYNSDDINYYKEPLQDHYKERLLDGANIIDLYRDVCIFAENWENQFGKTWDHRKEQWVSSDPNHSLRNNDQQLQIWFWQVAQEVLVDKLDHADEEQ